MTAPFGIIQIFIIVYMKVAFRGRNTSKQQHIHNYKIISTYSFFNPLPMNDQDRISPYNIKSKLSRYVTIIKKMSN